MKSWNYKVNLEHHPKYWSAPERVGICNQKIVEIQWELINGKQRYQK